MSKNNLPSDNLSNAVTILQQILPMTGPTGTTGATGPVNITGTVTVDSLVSFASSSQIKNVSGTVPVITSLGQLYFNSTNFNNRNIIVGNAVVVNSSSLNSIIVGDGMTIGANVGNNNIIMNAATTTVSSSGLTRSTILNSSNVSGTGGTRLFVANCAGISAPGNNGIFINTATNLLFAPGSTGQFYIHTGLGTSIGGETQLMYSSANGRISRMVSSIRFKTNIQDLDDERINNAVPLLSPKTYNFIDGNTPSIGLIAEDVFEHFPEICTLDEEGEPFSIRYDLLSVILLSKIKSQQSVVDDLISRVTALEN
jgi:hypothetical protein